MTTPSTATSIRYKQAEAELARRILSEPEQQWEAIARYYVAHAKVAAQVLTLLKIKDQTMLPLPDLDYGIKMLIDTIKANHFKDFGIELEWPNPNSTPT